MVLTARWQRTLTVVFIAQLTTAVGFSSIFPFLPLYVKALGTTTGLSLELLSGLVFSGQAFTMMLASPVWGALADRFGRKLMVERAMFGGALILLLMAFVRSAEQLVLLRAIQGLITGTISAANALVAAETPRQRTGYAMGLLQVSLGAGVALGPLLGGAIADWLGYRAAFFATAALLFGSGLLVWRGVQEDFIPVERSAHEKGNFLSSWQQITAAPGVMLVYSLRFISQLGRNMLVSVAPLFIQALLLASAQLNFFTGLVVGVSAATTTISAVYLGRLGDRIGHRRVIVVCALLAALLYLPQGLVTAGWQLLLFQALVGVALGGVIPGISALLARFTRPGLEGAVFGLDNAIDAAGRALGPLVGAGIAAWLGLRAPFPLTGLLLLGMTGLALRLPKTGSG